MGRQTLGIPDMRSETENTLLSKYFIFCPLNGKTVGASGKLFKYMEKLFDDIFGSNGKKSNNLKKPLILISFDLLLQTHLRISPRKLLS